MNPFEEGQVILVNKPLHWTSADVVKKIRNRIHAKVGHAGTLDPLATGLLILCTGKFTKKINEYMAKEKEYTGTITLGATTASYDLETTPENQKDFSNVSAVDLVLAAEKFTGEIMQVPPVYSAIKKDGVRSYDLARQGRAVPLSGRKVMVRVFEIEILQLPLISFRVVCSTGTYIRSLANDIGEYLGCGAYLSSLCRTRIGEYLLKDAIDPESKELIRMDN
ncbi:MAG TPA: tRNA pseudouridine(55) synthase TruB [Chitinophagaceae bacterium]|nr:tRNA pseudouridine(55) synthase TruB [Chitinophagaceae bacterium]